MSINELTEDAVFELIAQKLIKAEQLRKAGVSMNDVEHIIQEIVDLYRSISGVNTKCD